MLHFEKVRQIIREAYFLAFGNLTLAGEDAILGSILESDTPNKICLWSPKAKAGFLFLRKCFWKVSCKHCLLDPNLSYKKTSNFSKILIKNISQLKICIQYITIGSFCHQTRVQTVFFFNPPFLNNCVSEVEKFRKFNFVSSLGAKTSFFYQIKME